MIAELQPRVADGSIAAVKGIGPARLEHLRATLARWEHDRQVAARGDGA
jgi:hypothetical protein